MRILLQTALNLEFDAMKTFLTNIESVIHPTTGSKYEKGIFTCNGMAAEILLVETGAGNVRAADETSRAIEFFTPDYTFFVGVAGGLKDVQLGDVVASTKVIGYEMGKDDEQFKPRLDTLQSAYQLQQTAKQLLRNDAWKKRLPVDSSNKVNAFVEPIAAGEKVVASEKAVAYKYLRQYCSDALAVAMEGNGFMVAAHSHNVKAMEIRGISDMIDDKEEADASGSQPRAAENAAAFAFAMIETITKDNQRTIDISDAAIKRSLLDVLLELYPQGPEENYIWQRAGGDITIFTNSSSRRSQWFNALEKLALGGGGRDISLETLINAVQEDYPNRINQFLTKNKPEPDGKIID